jgi:hypothetical protein
MKMKIKSSRSLIREWDELVDKINSCASAIETCSGIIGYNDRTITESELIDWKIRVMDLQAYLLGLKFTTEILMNDTLVHIKNCNTPTLKAKTQ